MTNVRDMVSNLFRVSKSHGSKKPRTNINNTGRVPVQAGGSSKMPAVIIH